MKIIVKEPGERPIRIFLPNFLLRGPIVRKILLYGVSHAYSASQTPQISQASQALQTAQAQQITQDQQTPQSSQPEQDSQTAQESQTEESFSCTPEQLGALYDAFSQCLKKFKGLKLVEVESADGSTVLIEL